MSVSEKESGIVDTHTAALESLAASQNTFLFVRPTEYDTTILIREGYATKSMDVHHKSSNWGPMAGFVPCDPAFSKKCEGLPNSKEHEHKHGDAHPTQLSLKNSLLAKHEKIDFPAGYTLAAAPPGSGRGEQWVAKRVTESTSRVGAARAQFESFQTSGALPTFRFCTAKPAESGNKATLFCLIKKGDEWLVNWVKWESGIGRLHPLRVFAYPQAGLLNPVTGDYDLWMVAPHFKHFDDHALVRIQKDSHGSSAASGYTLKLLPLMNLACNRTSNPVFNHGAEEQNYGFTQALDWNLAMFTPGGGSRMVRMNQMPAIMGDLHQAGYLVVWNKRYGENDPRLMGKADARPTLGAIRTELDSVYKELDEIKRTAAPGQIAKDTLSTRKMPGAMQAELLTMSRRFDASRKLGLEQSRIYRFNRGLLEFLAAMSPSFRGLSPSDFPATVRSYDIEVHKLHGELQRAMVAATKGDGDSDASLSLWLTQHKTDIDKLKRYWA